MGSEEETPAMEEEPKVGEIVADEAPTVAEEEHTEEEEVVEESTTNNLSFESLPWGWIEAVDPTSGKTYYYNEESDATSWERPVNGENSEQEEE